MDADCVTAEQMAARIRELRLRHTEVGIGSAIDAALMVKNPANSKANNPRLKKIEERLESLFVRYKETSRNELIHELASLGGNR